MRLANTLIAGGRSRGALLLLGVAMLLAGCYPDLDWRELQWRDGDFSVMFPARPTEVTREIELGGTALELHMLRAEVKDMAFGVAYADLPAGVDANVLLTAARDGLVRNIGGRIIEEQTVELPGLNGQAFRAEGHAADHDMMMAARVLTGGGRFYQVLFIGPRANSAEVDLDFYLGSFKRLNP